MNTRSLALIITFAAVAIVLNTVKIPTIYWPGASYGFSEIPIVVAFLLFGPKIGVLVGLLNFAGQEVLFPLGAPFMAAYPIAFTGLLFMLLGIYLSTKYLARKKAEKTYSYRKRTFYLTAFASATRGAIMPVIIYGVFYRIMLPLVGINLPENILLGLIPSFFIFALTVPLYTIPIAYFVATKVSKSLQIESHFPDSSTRDPSGVR
jgi:riboflavin transporter FmnP